MALVAGGLPETSSHISPLTLEFWLYSVSMLVMILKQHVTPISAIYMAFTVTSSNCKVKIARLYEFLFTLG